MQYLNNTFILCIAMLLINSCGVENRKNAIPPYTDDPLVLASMIAERERAMAEKDIESALDQFSDDATWINSQGYFFEGLESIAEFHQMLAGNDTLDYHYEAGEPRIRVLDSANAIVYYSWKMFWYLKQSPSDTTHREIGLMTLTARKSDTGWHWVAVTNQHTPWFYDRIEPVFIEE